MTTCSFRSSIAVPRVSSRPPRSTCTFSFGKGARFQRLLVQISHLVKVRVDIFINEDLTANLLEVHSQGKERRHGAVALVTAVHCRRYMTASSGVVAATVHIQHSLRFRALANHRWCPPCSHQAMCGCRTVLAATPALLELCANVPLRDTTCRLARTWRCEPLHSCALFTDAAARATKYATMTIALQRTFFFFETQCKCEKAKCAILS